MARPRNGPERFWSRGPVRIASGVAFAISFVAHALLFPIDLQPIEIHDVEGEAAIAVDVLSLAETQAAERTAAQQAKGSGDTAGIAESPSVLPEDGGAATVGALDGDDGTDGPLATDASGALDGSPASDGSDMLEGSPASRGNAGNDGGDGRDGGDEAVVPGNDAAAPDPGALIGAIQTERVLVMLVVNAEVIRRNPVGARMGYLLRGIPQWSEFMAGTTLDPVRDTDWIVISGPSLVNTERDVVLIHYSAPDRLIDRAIASLGRRYARGGAIDAGVPGVKATLAHADRAERVILRPQPRVLARREWPGNWWAPASRPRFGRATRCTCASSAHTVRWTRSRRRSNNCACAWCPGPIREPTCSSTGTQRIRHPLQRRPRSSRDSCGGATTP
jgi:hypothetical protein